MEIQWLENIKLFTKWKQFSATVWRVHVPMRRKSHCDLNFEPLYTRSDEAQRGRKGGLSEVDPIGDQRQCRQKTQSFRLEREEIEMRRILVLTAITLPLPAFAHVGHLSDLAGHSHWIALGALGIATVVGALANVKGKGKSPDPEEGASSDEDTESQEAAA
jgi:hypothetical protein